MELFTLGIDLGKMTFHLVGMNQRGEAQTLLANLPETRLTDNPTFRGTGGQSGKTEARMSVRYAL
jgi:hypothetical protein